MEAFAVREYVPETDEYLFHVPAGSHENLVAANLLASGDFQYVEPDWLLFPVGVPNDPRFGDQWHHAANRMNSAAGWDLHTGNPSVTVAICDTGVLTTHEDLLLHRMEGYNAVDRVWESAGGNIGPVHSHGTNCTGSAAANGNNGKGVSGVGWNLSHRMMRVSNSSGGGAYQSDLTHAARTAVDAGDRVASVSYTGGDSASPLTTATYLKSQGGLLVWAAGNDGRYLTYGNRDADDMIVVGASDSGDNLAYFTAYGPYVDLMAPGVGIWTTNSSSNSSYASVSGTSFATPITAGLIALIWSADPNLTPNEVEALLKSSCDDKGAAGVDNTWSYGRVNVNNAMVAANGGGGGLPPVAEFSGTPVTGTAPLVVDFSDLSTRGPTAWSWDFGDGGSSTQQNPSYTYSAAGTYSVTLVVSNAYGQDTMPKTGYVTVDEPGGGGYTGQGFILSKNANFSTDDRSFSRDDTLYMIVWSDQIDFNNMRREYWQLRSGKDKVRQNFTNNGDGTWTGAFDLSGLPPNRSNWSFSAQLQDKARTTYKPSASITVN
ncbi:MAG: S8 family serine peptidase [Planctomycetes bacterium]|nr:S8 family serine peptidase [Planctomycetota bacterium]MBL7009311.1 S8 family serine peptidase [Planctomycetota bacterium]